MFQGVRYNAEKSCVGKVSHLTATSSTPNLHPSAPKPFALKCKLLKWCWSSQSVLQYFSTRIFRFRFETANCFISTFSFEDVEFCTWRVRHRTSHIYFSMKDTNCGGEMIIETDPQNRWDAWSMKCSLSPMICELWGVTWDAEQMTCAKWRVLNNYSHTAVISSWYLGSRRKLTRGMLMILKYDVWRVTVPLQCAVQMVLLGPSSPW
jgi:hypothetical protein